MNEEKRPIFNFGKYKGKLVADICAEDPNYFNWLTIDMVNKIPKDTIHIVKGIFEKTKKVVTK